MKVRIGQTVTGGKVHLSIGVATCPVAARKPLINSIPAHKVDVAELCHWCRRQDNLAAVWRENCYGPVHSVAIDTLLINVKPVRSVRQELERAIEAANAREAMEQQFAGDASRASSGAVLVSAADRATAERARRLAVVAQYRETEAEQPELVPLSAFGAMKARYAQTHRPVTGRVAHVRLAA